MSPQAYAATATTWTRVGELFDAAADLGDDERGRFLDKECGDDIELRRRVEALLIADAQVGNAGDITHAIGAGIDALLHSPAPAQAGTRIGAFTVIEVLGRGGMGVVFLAERDDKEIQQRVAIKVVSGIALGPEAIRRFRSERQILARLEHPYIAHLIDGGETAEGVPFLVMEYVEGQPILSHCADVSLDFDGRLNLFLKICEALQFAHQNLIVHRDIKPSNIMVTRDGFPKLLDFGIAKIIDPQEFGQQTVMTQVGQRVCTPDHAAPEQLEGKAVTTATDVYCLGMLLYQLLTGRRPYTLALGRRMNINSQIGDLTPPAPSDALSQIEKHQIKEVEPPTTTLPLPSDQLRRKLRGDLDNIIMKALRREPERRYGSVAEFAEDIRRYRRHLPVSARPDTWRYRTHKFIVRNAVGVASVAGIMLLLVTLVAATKFQSKRIDEQRLVAESIGSFLTEVLVSADPNVARGNEVTAEQLLDEGSKRITTELKGQPEVQARMMSTMGVTYTNLGNYERAKPLLEAALSSQQSLGADPLTLVRTRNAYGKVLIEQAAYEPAAMVFRQALTTARKELGAEHSEVSRSLTGLGLALMETRDYEGAEALLREAYALDRRILAPDDAMLADSSTGLGSILWRRDQFPEAEKYYMEALQLRRRLLGDSHPDTVESVNNLAALLTNRGDHAGAEVLFREALAQNERLLGTEHPDIAINLNNLGYVLMVQGNFAEAEIAYNTGTGHRKQGAGSRPSRSGLQPEQSG